MGSSDSGISPRPTVVKAISKVFNSPSSRMTTIVSASTMKKKDKSTIQKRRNSRKMDRESLPVANSQFYTNPISSITNLLSPSLSLSSQTSVATDRDSKESITTNLTSSPAPSTSTITLTNTPLFELTEELTPKRPLRSEVEREKRLSRTQSQITATGKIDNGSVSGESSNSRNSIITTDSQTSEEDPPPLPAKTFRDSDSFYQVEESLYSPVRRIGYEESNYSTLTHSSNLVSNANYEYCEIRSSGSESLKSQGKKTPPTPPPKPVRTSSRLSNTPKSPMP